MPRRLRDAVRPAAALRPRLDPAAALRKAIPRDPRRRRFAGAALALVVVVAATYLFWFRDSGLVAVDKVTVSGVTGQDADEIRAALVRAGKRMTTLHVDQDALEAAVKRFPEVRGLDARGDFPSGLRIVVAERRAAAILVAGDRRFAVAGDGTVLPGGGDLDELPEVRVKAAPPARRLAAGDPLDVVTVLGAAPGALAPRLEKAAREDDRGVVVQVAEGPELIFGRATKIEAKWAAATRILADDDSTGATYIDLSIPERPAAGGLAVETVAPVVPAGEEIEPPAAPETQLAEPQP